MTLMARQEQSVVCDTCEARVESPSGGAPHGWYIITAGPGDASRYDFCGWGHLVAYFRAADGNETSEHTEST